jgi:Flp pilus assembly protein TadD
MSDKDTYLKKGELSYQKRDFKTAIDWFSQALNLDGNDADLYSTRGVAYFHLGDLPASLQDLNTAQSLEPNNPYRYSSRAYIKDAMGDTHGAILDYQKTIELDPEDAVAFNNLGMLEEKLGHQAKAQTLFKFADDLARGENPTPETFERPKNIQKEINEKRKEESLGNEIKKVFTSKSAFKEFVSFVKNGFKK